MSSSASPHPIKVLQLPNPPAERPAASPASNNAASRLIASIKSESVDAPLPRGDCPGIEAEEAIWHIAASELLNHDSIMTQCVK
jgi:hypothetical protein